MCIDNPTVKPDRGGLDKLINEEIGAQVRPVLASKHFVALRALHPGMTDVELLALAVKTASLVGTALYTGDKPLFYVEEFAR